MRWRTLALASSAAVAMLACSDEQTTSPNKSVAPISPGSSSTILAAPHEPSGLTQFTDRPFNAIGEGWLSSESTPNFSIVSDASAPKSPSKVGQITFKSGFTGGTSPATAQFTLPQGPRTVFVSVWFKLSSNFVGSSTSPINAIFNLTNNAQQRVTFVASGTGSNTLVPAVQLTSTADPRSTLAAAGSPTIAKGSWQQVEALVTMNTPGAADGVVRVWLNGAKVIDYRDVKIVKSGEADTFGRLQLAPNWGTSSSRVSSSMTIRYDEVYASGSASRVTGGDTGGATLPPVDTTASNNPSDPTGPASKECSSAKTGWIFCDDFEQDRTGKYFEYDNASGKFVRSSGNGLNGSTSMRATYTKGQTSAGYLHLAIGRTPSATFRPADAGTANYRELYWRVWVKRQAGWTGDGPSKLTRATILAKSDWSQAMFAHYWSDESNPKYMFMDPASGTDASGNLVTSGYNDFNHMNWLGGVRSDSTYEDNAHAGKWICYEFHVKLNDPGQSNALDEMYVNGRLSARKSGFNWIGKYSAYGINAVFLEQYWNGGAPATESRDLDNFVVSTQPIGCGNGGSAPPPTQPPTQPPTNPTPVVTSVTVTPANSTMSVGQTVQLKATDIDQSGTVMTGQTNTWTSSNKSVANVSSSGMVTAVAAGSATIKATNGSISGSATITVSAPTQPTQPPPPSGGGADNAHEPSGFTMVTNRPFSSLAKSCSDASAAEGWEPGEECEWSHISIIQDPTAPKSPNSVLQAMYPSGTTGGTIDATPGRIVKNFSAAKSVYTSVWVKLSPNFVGNGTWTNKVFFIWINGHPNFFMSAEGAGTGALAPTGRLQGTMDSREKLPPNLVSSAVVQRGQWQHWEVLVKANTPGQANGEFHLWVNGTKVSEYKNVAYLSSGESQAFMKMDVEPIWGGGGSTLSAAQYMYFDNVYVSKQ